MAVGSVQRSFAHPLSVLVTRESNYSLTTVDGIDNTQIFVASTLNAKVLVPESTARAAEVMGGKHLVNKGFFHWDLCYKL